MSNLNLSKKFDALPPWAKGTIAVAGTAITLFTLYKVYQKISDKLNKSSQENKNLEGIDAVNKDAQKVAGTQKLKYLPAQYNSYADALYSAMHGIGTDTDKIYSVIRMMTNNADIYQLIKAFGIREYTDNKIGPFNILKLNLNQWFGEELSDNEIYKVNEILTKNRIAYQF